MAPLTRLHSEQAGDVPTNLMAEYYGQRASEGFSAPKSHRLKVQILNAILTGIRAGVRADCKPKSNYISDFQTVSCILNKTVTGH
jgi:hypothetical protein